MYGEVDGERGLAALDHAIGAGATFVDTADGYGGGANEELVGRAIAGRRDEVQVATKFGLNLPDGVGPPGPGRLRSGELASTREPGNVRRYLRGEPAAPRHRPRRPLVPALPRPRVPIEDTVAAVAELVGEGRSATSGSQRHRRPARARRPGPPARGGAGRVVLWNRGAERRAAALAREPGVGFVAWGPLGNGFLAGDVELAEDDFRRTRRASSPRTWPATATASPRCAGSPRSAGVTPGPARPRLAAAPDARAVPIPGSRTPAHIDENLAAAEVRARRRDAGARRRGSAPVGAAAGARCSSGLRRRVVCSWGMPERGCR